MDIIAMDCHKHYSLANVQTADGQLGGVESYAFSASSCQPILSAAPRSTRSRPGRRGGGPAFGGGDVLDAQ